MSSTKTNTENSSSKKLPNHHNYTIDDILFGYVQSPDGAVCRVIPKKKDVAFVILAVGLNMQPVPAIRLLEHLNKGDWKFSKELTEEMKYPKISQEVLDHKHKVLSALFFGQLALEANDALIETADHNKYLANTLRKSNKELERLTARTLQGVYGADPETLHNIFKSIEDVIGRMANKLPHEFFFIGKVMDDYEKNTEKWHKKPIELDKINS